MCGRAKVFFNEGMFHLIDRAGIVHDSWDKEDWWKSLPWEWKWCGFNIAPTEQLPVIHEHAGGRHFSAMTWWLTPHWSDGPSQKYAMFNARAEGIEKSRAYKGPFQYRRAIIPVDAFYEWRREGNQKIPYLIEAEEGAFALAGVWDSWSDGVREILSCSIITTEASDAFKPIHHRMPVILDWNTFDQWLDEKSDIAEIRKMLVPYTKPLKATPMSPKMNNARYKENPEPAGEKRVLVPATGTED